MAYNGNNGVSAIGFVCNPKPSRKNYEGSDLNHEEIDEALARDRAQYRSLNVTLRRLTKMALRGVTKEDRLRRSTYS